MNKLIQSIEQEQMKSDIPDFAPGDTVVVQEKLRKATASVCSPSKAWSSPSAIAA